MIIECPKCRTTHSKPASEVRDGATVTCRKCSTPFRVTPSGQVVGLMDDDATAADVSTTSPTDGGFNQASTEVMKIPASVAGLQAAAAASESSDFDDLKTSQMSTVEVQERLAGLQKASAQAIVDAADEEEVFNEAPTEVADAAQLRALAGAGEAGADGDAQAADESDAGLDPFEPAFAGGPGLGLNATIDDSDSVHQDMARSLPLGDERPAPRPMPSLAGVGGSAATMPEFPSTALAAWASGMLAYVKAQTMPVKVILASAVLVVLILFALAVSAVFGGDSNIAYADEDQQLMAGPGPASVYSRIGTVQRGEVLATFEGGAVGGYYMVRDVMGRVGYLPASSISLLRPVSLPGLAFAGCRQSPFEPDMSMCQERAQTQFDSCRSVCDDEADAVACREHCQEWLDICIRGCEGLETMVPEPAAIEPSLDDLEPAAVPTVSDLEPASKSPSKKRSKKKTRRKKKRRR